MRVTKMKNQIGRVFLLCFITVNLSAQGSTNKYDFARLCKNLPFKMPVLSVPKFPNKTFNIKDFGAVGDGQTVNTPSFAKAVDACSKSGGGKIIVPAGIWLTGPIIFKDNVNLHLESGAFIQFSKNINDYPLIESNWEGVNQYRCTSPITGRNLKNIAITGSGILDGGGEAWRMVKKEKLTEIQWKDLLNSGGVVDAKGTGWFPAKESMDAPGILAELKKQNKTITKEEAEKYKIFFRPVMVSFIECKNVWLDGVTFQNSPAWNLHPLLSENVLITNLNVRNPWYSQNGDGIDLESCKNSLIYNCKFDVGDDAICMKSGKDAEGRKRGRATENLVVQDCIVYHGHGGFTIGSEMSGDVRNIKVDNCIFVGTDIGLRFKSQRGRGGIVENIWVSNIFMKNIPTDALSFNMYYMAVDPASEKAHDELSAAAKQIPVTDETPQFKNIFMKNIFCNAARDAIVIQGLPEMSIKGIEIDNCIMKTDRGISIFDADGIKITNTTIDSKGVFVKVNQSKNIFFENLNPIGTYDSLLKVTGAKSANVSIKGKGAKQIADKTVFENGAAKEIVIVD
jgi:polygalacturonase